MFRLFFSSVTCLSTIHLMEKDHNQKITIVGAGLAGSEAAWAAAEAGVHVELFEMRPMKMTEAHQSGELAELVCSNSLGSDLPDRASGMLKAELRALGSLILRCADATRVPAGGALAVGREAFAKLVTKKLSEHSLISIHRAEIIEIPPKPAIIASGPLTSEPLANAIQHLIGEDTFYFYDALAPIVRADSIDMNIAFRASRYDRGEEGPGDYINCPLDQAQYEAFVSALLTAERIELRDFERDDARYFEGCLPIEVIASRGIDSLAYGPLRPVGLRDPHTGRRPHAIVQLRQDNIAGSLYNLVGFQTNIKWPEQQRILRMIPGLEGAEFERLGQMHRNSFINAPSLLESNMQLREHPGLFFAGQLTGIEGYIGNAGSGLVAGLNAARFVQGKNLLSFPQETMLGMLTHYICHAEPAHFQPMKANFGIMPALNPPVKGKRERYAAYANRGEAMMREFMRKNKL